MKNHGFHRERAEELDALAYAAKKLGVRTTNVALPEDVDVILRGLRFHYLDWGNSEQSPILFLHGGGLTAHTFDLVCLSLRDKYHCIALDQRGHGDSEWSPVMDYGLSTHAADIATFAASLGLRRLTAVGMSMGGLNALKFAADHGADLMALVLIDIGPDIQEAGSKRIRGFMAESSDLDSIDDYIKRAIALNPRRDPKRLRRSLLHNLRATPTGKWAWKWDPRPRQRDPELRHRSLERATLWADVSRVSCPTLVVRGEESDVFSAEDARQLVERLQRGTLATVPAAGHSVQGDNPAGLTHELLSFFDRIGF